MTDLIGVVDRLIVRLFVLWAIQIIGLVIIIAKLDSIGNEIKKLKKGGER